MKYAIFLSIALMSWLFMGSCIEHIEHIQVSLTGMDDSNGLCIELSGVVHNPEMADGDLTVGVCYVYNEKREPTIADHVVEATEIDPWNKFTVYISDYKQKDRIYYRLFTKTKHEVQYSKTEYITNLQFWTNWHKKIGLSQDSHLPHDAIVTALVDLGPLDPSSYEYYLCYGKKRELTFNVNPTVQAYIDENNEIETHLTDLEYNQNYYVKLFLRRLADDQIIAGTDFELKIPGVSIHVYTLPINQPVAVPEMQLSGRVEIKYGEISDMSFHISWRCPGKSGKVPALFNEADSTFTATLADLEYNKLYSYWACVEYPNKEETGQWYHFLTPPAE